MKKFPATSKGNQEGTAKNGENTHEIDEKAHKKQQDSKLNIALCNYVK